MRILSSLSVPKKIALLAIVLIMLILITALTSIVSMNSIGQELESIAHKDLPLIEKLTKITEYQLEQSIHFERTLHFGIVGLLEEKGASDKASHYHRESGEKFYVLLH